MQFVPVDFDGHGRADLLLFGNQQRGKDKAFGLHRLDGGTGRPVWESTRSKGDNRWDVSLLEPPQVLDPAPDLDDDGVRDAVAFERWGLLVVSGRDGSLRLRTERGLVGPPALADADGDGRPDLIGTFFGPKSLEDRFIQAYSARTGRSLWEWRFPRELVRRNKLGPEERIVQFPLPSPSTVVTRDGREVVVAITGNHLVGVDLATGVVAWEPADLGHDVADPPVHVIGDLFRFVMFTDLDGRGEPEALLVVWGRVVAFSLEEMRVLWTGGMSQHGDSLTWSVVDLDDDHKPEVVLAGLQKPGILAFKNHADLEVLDGATGVRRWGFRVPGKVNSGFQRITVGPDVDGDGVRELFTATHGNPGELSSDIQLLVHALSGRTGSVLWMWAEPDEPAIIRGERHAGPLTWWGTGADGAARLVVSIQGLEGIKPKDPRARLWMSTRWRVVVLSARTGRLCDDLRTARHPRLVALNGTGPPALAAMIDSSAFVVDSSTASRLVVLRGDRVPVWQRLGAWRPSADFDGDGITDLLPWDDYGTRKPISAVAGADGRVLWQSDLVAVQAQATPTPTGDLDGDGVADVLVVLPRDGRWPGPLVALSGRGGRRLWTSRDFPHRPDNGEDKESVALACITDRDGDGRPDVALGFEHDSRRPGVPNAFAHVVVLSGRDGRRVERAEAPEFPVPKPQDSVRNHDWTIPLCGPSGRPMFVTSGSGSSQTQCFLQPLAAGPHVTQPAFREPDGSQERR
jgi:hypothetical protein